MGNTCSPDTGAEKQVKDTDTVDPKDASGAGDLASKTPKQLFEILNDHIDQIEKLKKENAELKDKETKDAGPSAENKKLLEELEQLRALTKQQSAEISKSKAVIEEEELRIAKLKLRSELMEKEAEVMTESTAVASILIEGDLLKFTKGGKGKPSYKNVSIHLRAGETTFLVTQPKKDAPKETVPVGWAPGSLVLVWADDEKSQTLSRAPITELIDGATAVNDKEYENRTFSLKTSPGDKIIAFAASNEEEKERWFKTIADAMESIKSETEEMHVQFDISREFTSRPLGFRVEEQVLETKDGKTSDVLMVTKVDPALAKEIPTGLIVVKCNDTSFAGLKYSEKLEAIKSAEFPFNLTFRGQEFIRAGTTKATTVRAKHNRDVSMQVLYPELFAELTKDGSSSREALLKHPLVQGNPEFKSWLERSDFKDLLQDLMSDPEKLRQFLTNKEL